MNKLLFIWERFFNTNVEIIANNEKDLQEYLESNFDLCHFKIIDNQVQLRERNSSDTEYIDLKWIKHI